MCGRNHCLIAPACEGLGQVFSQLLKMHARDRVQILPRDAAILVQIGHVNFGHSVFLSKAGSPREPIASDYSRGVVVKGLSGAPLDNHGAARPLPCAESPRSGDLNNSAQLTEARHG